MASSTGGIIAQYTYDEYGIKGSANAGRFQYTGQAWLPELGMYYYKARIYSPTLGRFLQTDPIGYEDNVNLYAYVANDPVNGTDFTGMEEDREPSLRRRVATALCSVGLFFGQPTDHFTPPDQADQTDRSPSPPTTPPKETPREPVRRSGSQQQPIEETPRSPGSGRRSIRGPSGRIGGILGIVTAPLGVLSGRIRTDNPDNFFSDMTGVPSEDDRNIIEIEREDGTTLTIDLRDPA